MKVGLTNNARVARRGHRHAGPGSWRQLEPLFHVAGCGLLTLGLAHSTGTQVLMPHFDPGLQLELTEAYRGVCFGGVPTMLTALLNHPSLARHDLSSLRYGLSGAPPVPAELVRGWRPPWASRS